MRGLKDNMAPKIMNVLHLLLGLFLLIGFEAKAQVLVQTKGVPENVEQEISSQTESFLTAFMERDLSGYSQEILSEEIQARLSELEVLTDENTVNTTAVRTGNGYEVGGILMKSFNEHNVIEEVVLEFSSSTELIKVRLGDELSNTAWIVARNMKVSNSGTKQLLGEILERYETILEEKNGSALKTLFTEDGFAISSTESETFDGYDIVKYSNNNYINRLSERIFRDVNHINIYLEDANMYHHPVLDDVYGISVRQTWNSTIYADQGHLFVVVDNRGEELKIYSRVWQKQPFNQFEFLVKELDPYEVQLSHKKLLTNDISRSFDGEIEFVVSGEQQGLITAELLVENIENGTFQVDGAELETAHLELSEGNLVIPFVAKPKKGEQFVNSSFYMAESSTLKELNTDLNLYIERRNIVEIKAGNDLSSPEKPNYFEHLNLTFNTDSVNIKLKSETGRILTDATISDSTVSFELLAGTYYLYASKAGFNSVRDTAKISIGDYTDKEIVLKSFAPKPVTDPKPKGFIAKNKLWLLGGAAAVITSTTLILSTGGSESAGLPIPPGRPLGN